MLPTALENIIKEYAFSMMLHDKRKSVLVQMRHLQLVHELGLIFSCCYEQNQFVVGLCLVLIAELNREQILSTD